MKKIAMFLAVALLTAGALFAQTAGNSNLEAANSYADITTQVIDIEDVYGYLHPNAKNVKIQLEYTPLTGTVRLYYTCLAASFDQGEAMNTAMAVYENFAIENQYKHYTYQGKDRTRYFKENNIRMAEYCSYVNFTR